MDKQRCYKCSYFSDCASSDDPNALSRLEDELTQEAYSQGVSLLSSRAYYTEGDVDTGFCLADLFARARIPTILIGNGAPREDKDLVRVGYENGSPFGFCRIGNCLIVATVDGYTFSMVQKLAGRPIDVHVMHIPDVVGALLSNEPERAELMVQTQFRSLEFLIWATMVLAKGEQQIPSKPFGLVPKIGNRVVYIDTVGKRKKPYHNIKTSLTVGDLRELGIDLRSPFFVRIGDQTKEVEFCPGGLKTEKEDHRVRLAPGSSGIRRIGYELLELQVKNGDAWTAFDQPELGTEIFFPKK